MLAKFIKSLSEFFQFPPPPALKKEVKHLFQIAIIISKFLRKKIDRIMGVFSFLFIIQVSYDKHTFYSSNLIKNKLRGRDNDGANMC